MADTTALEAKRLVAGGARLVDVRARYEYAEGHLPGAVSLPVEEIERRAAELGPRDRPVVVYCHTGIRAWFAVRALRHAGFTRVHNLSTMTRWGRPDPLPNVQLF